MTSYNKDYYQKNKEKFGERQKAYNQSHKEKIKEYQHKYYETNKDREGYKEKSKESQKRFRMSPKWRAKNLVGAYNTSDSKANRGKGDLTAKWVFDNILFKPCAHCGREGWDIIGCNRLDNSKPHSKDNVEPCCFKCNVKLNGKELSKQIYQYTLDGELVKVWDSIMDIEIECGFARAAISYCCNGKRKTAYGYIWSIEPIAAALKKF